MTSKTRDPRLVVDIFWNSAYHSWSLEAVYAFHLVPDSAASGRVEITSPGLMDEPSLNRPRRRRPGIFTSDCGSSFGASISSGLPAVVLGSTGLSNVPTFMWPKHL